MIRLDHVLVQQQSHNENYILFHFRGKRRSVYSFFVAMILLTGTILIENMDNSSVHYKEYIVLGGYLFSGMFALSSIYSYFTKILLEIDGNRKIVEYRKTNLFGIKEWKKSFDSFIEVRLWLRGQTTFWKVILRMKDNQEIPLGTSEAGVFGKDKAYRMAKNIADIMKIDVIEEKSFWNS